MLKDPKLALAIAIHQGAVALMIDHGEGAMNKDVAVSKSKAIMNNVLGETPDVSYHAILAEFVNARAADNEKRMLAAAR